MADEENSNEKLEEKLAKAEKGKRISLVVGIGLGIVLGVTAAVLTILEAQKADEAVVEEVVEEEVEIEPEYLEDTITNIPVPLLDKYGKVLYYVYMDFRIEVRNDDDVDFVEERIPRVIEAFNIEMTQNSISKPGQVGTIDYAAVSKRLVNAANKALGRPAVTNVNIVKVIAAG